MRKSIHHTHIHPAHTADPLQPLSGIRRYPADVIVHKLLHCLPIRAHCFLLQARFIHFQRWPLQIRRSVTILHIISILHRLFQIIGCVIRRLLTRIALNSIIYRILNYLHSCLILRVLSVLRGNLFCLRRCFRSHRRICRPQSLLLGNTFRHRRPMQGRVSCMIALRISQTIGSIGTGAGKHIHTRRTGIDYPGSERTQQTGIAQLSQGCILRIWIIDCSLQIWVCRFSNHFFCSLAQCPQGHISGFFQHRTGNLAGKL